MFGKIPTTWATISLRNIATLIRGVSFSGDEARNLPAPGYVPVLRAGNISDDLIIDRDLVWIPESRVSEEQMLKQGDIAICMSSGSNAIVGKTAVLNSDWNGCVGAFCAVIRPTNHTASSFLANFFTGPQFRHWRRSRAQGANIQNLRATELERLRVPIPPLSEQLRIAHILHESEGLRQICAQSDSKVQDLIPALFSGIVGDLSANQREWRLVPVSDFVSEFEGGKSLPDEGSDVPGRARVLKISAVTSGKFDPTESKSVPSGYEPPAHHFVKPGDLLISRANTPELVGATAYVDECPPDTLLSDKLWRFVWRNPEQVSPLFMSAFFRNRYIRYKISRLATGTGGSMKNISKKKLMSMRVPLPPYEVQKKFEAICAEVRAIQRMMAESESARELTASLLARAFTGELTAEWRERNADKLEQEARDRDAALAASGVKLSRAPKPADIEAIFTRRTDGAYAELTREQHTVLEAAQKAVGGVKTPRWFTAEDIARQLGGTWRKNIHAIEAALSVLAARGLVIAVSREDAQPITGEIYFGTAYRLPRKLNEH
jgi:type I restriction enzyme S subunit